MSDQLQRIVLTETVPLQAIEDKTMAFVHVVKQHIKYNRPLTVLVGNTRYFIDVVDIDVEEVLDEH